jgi:leucyl-tRNA synthetase
VRARLTVPSGLDEAATEAAARADERVAALLVGMTVRKVIVVTGRLVNFVVG